MLTNTPYVFSAWRAMAFHQTPSKFYFFVNDTPQCPVVDLPVEAGIWQNYSATWNPGAASVATLEIRLNSTRPTGNDVYVDDFSFRRVNLAAPLVTGDGAANAVFDTIAGGQTRSPGPRADLGFSKGGFSIAFAQTIWYTGSCHGHIG